MFFARSLSALTLKLWASIPKSIPAVQDMDSYWPLSSPDKHNLWSRHTTSHTKPTPAKKWCGFSRRFDASYREAHARIAQGTYGQPVVFRSQTADLSHPAFLSSTPKQVEASFLTVPFIVSTLCSGFLGRIAKSKVYKPLEPQLSILLWKPAMIGTMQLQRWSFLEGELPLFFARAWWQLGRKTPQRSSAQRDLWESTYKAEGILSKPMTQRVLDASFHSIIMNDSGRLLLPRHRNSQQVAWIISLHPSAFRARSGLSLLVKLYREAWSLAKNCSLTRKG